MYIPKHNLLCPYKITCMYVFRDDQFYQTIKYCDLPPAKSTSPAHTFPNISDGFLIAYSLLQSTTFPD